LRIQLVPLFSLHPPFPQVSSSSFPRSRNRPVALLRVFLPSVPRKPFLLLSGAHFVFFFPRAAPFPSSPFTPFNTKVFFYIHYPTRCSQPQFCLFQAASTRSSYHPFLLPERFFLQCFLVSKRLNGPASGPLFQL